PKSKKKKKKKISTVDVLLAVSIVVLLLLLGQRAFLSGQDDSISLKQQANSQANTQVINVASKTSVTVSQSVPQEPPSFVASIENLPEELIQVVQTPVPVAVSTPSHGPSKLKKPIAIASPDSIYTVQFMASDSRQELQTWSKGVNLQRTHTYIS